MHKKKFSNMLPKSLCNQQLTLNIFSGSSGPHHDVLLLQAKLQALVDPSSSAIEGLSIADCEKRFCSKTISL